ncbi:MAG: hypothetical protein OXI33_04535, partial [Chloroflexota bacterium]|nr:hypothetical protein [Chloroflexota bacterium]
DRAPGRRRARLSTHVVLGCGFAVRAAVGWVDVSARCWLSVVLRASTVTGGNAHLKSTAQYHMG